jgi:CheY-like chemotaxis protein
MEQNKDLDTYDIIFLDLDMPILNGFEACSQILEFYKVVDRENMLMKMESRLEQGHYLNKLLEHYSVQKQNWVYDLKNCYNKVMLSFKE